jgi:hypothetical protein
LIWLAIADHKIFMPYDSALYIPGHKLACCNQTVVNLPDDLRPVRLIANVGRVFKDAMRHCSFHLVLCIGHSANCLLDAHGSHPLYCVPISGVESATSVNLFSMWAVRAGSGDRRHWRAATLLVLLFRAAGAIVVAGNARRRLLGCNGLFPTENALNIADVFLLVWLDSGDHLNSVPIT